MKILLINNCHWLRGGAEIVYFNTARLLMDAGHEVVFFSFDRTQNIHAGAREYFVKRSGILGRIRNYFSNPTAARKMEEVLAKEHPDIAHIHLLWGGLSPSILKVLKQHKVPVVHTPHDYRMVCPAYLLKDGKGRFCERCRGGRFCHCLFNRCSHGNIFESAMMMLEMYYRNYAHHPVDFVDGFVFVSHFSKQKHVDFDKRFADAKSMVLYNCPGEDVESALDLSTCTFDNEYLFYGRLSHEKGLVTLIKAFEQYPQLRLNVLGTGPLDTELKSYCAKKGLENIRFYGYKCGKELFDIVSKAKYVCVPSECCENNPMTIVEAYSLGIPVIGAAIGGISEVVKNGETGYLFESGCVDSLSNVLIETGRIGKDEYNRQRHNAYHFYENNFSRSKYLERLVTFYKDVIND